ncbi:MAG TPA: ATP-binding protein [Oculatellaceae cyanobacterium]
MDTSETAQADRSAKHLTRLYILALLAIAVLLIAGQVVVQLSIFKSGGDTRVVNMAGRQRMFSQNLTKCSMAIDFAADAKTSEYYTRELERSIRQCTDEHEQLQTGADNLATTSPHSSQLHSKFAKLAPHYDAVIKSARAIVARERAQPFASSRKKEISSYTATILAEEPVVLDGVEDIVAEYVSESVRRTDQLAETEVTLLLATLLCLVSLGILVFRPAINQIRDIIQTLEKVQNRLDGTLSSMGDGLFQINACGEIVFANKSFETLLGYKFADVKRKNIHEMLHAIDDKHPRECVFIKTCMYSEETKVADDVFRRQDGSTIPVQLVSSPVLKRGERAGAVITFRDVREQIRLTRRMETQHAVTRILQEAATINEAMPKILAAVCECLKLDVGAVWLVDKDIDRLKCVAYQEPEHAKTGDFKSKTVSMSLRRGEGLPGKVWEKQSAVYVGAIQSAKDVVLRAEVAETSNLQAAFAFPIMQSQKVMAVVDLFGDHIPEPDEQLLTLVASMGNQIGEFMQRRIAEAHLRTNESRLNAIINSMAEGVIVADVNGAFLLVNQAAKNMHRTSTTGTSVSNWAKLFGYYEQDQKTPLANEDLPLLRAIRGESVDNQEIFLQPIGGDHGLWISCTARPLRDGSGDLIGGVVVLNDVTERKTAEKHLSVFYSTVSHELRTPLTSIKAALGLLEGGIAGQLSPKAMQLVNVGRSESDRLVRLINDILDVKKMEDGNFELQISAIDLQDLMHNSVVGLEAIANQNNIRLMTSLQEPITVNGDGDRLTQVLYNLIANAIKFSPEGGTIYIHAARQCEVVRISVRDEGCGIPEDQLHLLFKMFQQIKGDAAGHKQGTGLGLAICKRIVELHHGKIGIESTVNKGATFWFELPIHTTSAALS